MARTSQDIAAELAAAEARLAALRIERAAAEKRLNELTSQVADLGGSWKPGQVGRLRAELERARAAEARAAEDAARPRVRARIGAVEEEHVLLKVTPKRIFTRRPGEERERQWHHDGESVGGVYTLLDAAAVVAAHGKKP